jgi:HK97 gp10 family phage protein
VINLSAWGDSIKEAARASLEASAEDVARRAKQKAPVRKIFSGGRRKLRYKTVAEVDADAGLRERIGLGPETAAPAGYRGMPSRSGRKYARSVTRGNLVNMNAPAKMRRIGRPGHLRMAAAEEMLDRRGRSEVKSGRAAYEGKIGGRLKGEITATEARMDGSQIVANVLSPTSYAKYQEFGTRHHPAHPYMRPALEESRGDIVAKMRSAVKVAAARTPPGGGRKRKHKVILKAGGVR